jgi:tRNA isopentenyl-2-thiomethyl-A-37 hydroxylase MiaE
MKTEASADRKTRDENGGKYEKLTDVVRATVAVDSMAQMHEVVQHLQERGLKLAKLPADRFAKPMSTGYRDMNLKVQWPNGHVGELQLHLKPILEAKAAGHEHYERQRALAPKLATRSMTQGEWRAYDHAEREQRRLYGEAWHKAGGS